MEKIEEYNKFKEKYDYMNAVLKSVAAKKETANDSAMSVCKFTTIKNSDHDAHFYLHMSANGQDYDSDKFSSSVMLYLNQHIDEILNGALELVKNSTVQCLANCKEELTSMLDELNNANF